MKGNRKIIAVCLFAAEADRILSVEHGDGGVVPEEAVFLSVPLCANAEIGITGSRFLHREPECISVHRAVHAEPETDHIREAVPCPI